MNRSVVFALVVLIAGVSGCAAQPPVAPLMTANDPAVQQLNEAALRVARAAEQSALAQSIGNRAASVTEEYKIDLQRMPNELRQPLLLENGFNGELEVFLRSLTDAIGWPAPVILGNKPTTPLLVTMTEQRRPPINWIADAGYQAGSLADVSVNPSVRQLVLTYREAGGVR